MKFKKFFTTLALTGVLAFGTALFVCQSVGTRETKQARAETTNLGTFVFSEANNDSAVNYMYGINWTENEAPAGWDSEAFHPVDETSGTFVSGSRVGAEIKKIGPYTYYIAVAGATVGTVATVKGTWANSTYSFTVEEFVRQWNGTKWDYALEDYDVVSLADANIPDFENVPVITEDVAGYDYSTDPAALPSKKGFFGLTNSTGSYAFQFKFQKSGQSNGWFDIRIGGTGSWGKGHFLMLKMSNQWNANDGCARVYEYLDSGDIWNPTERQKGPEFLPSCFGGEEHTVEIGAIKVKGYENKHYIFFKTDDAVKWSDYWDLDAGSRTTRVGFYYTNSDAIVKNSIVPTSTKLHLSNGDSTTITLSAESDPCPAVGAWGEWFKSADGNGLKLNGTAFGSGAWNYFKKSNVKDFYIDLAGAGAGTIQSGDILYVGGMFKAARILEGEGASRINTLFKSNFSDSYFQFDGEAWHEVNPDYLVDDFAIDLLKLTLPICQNSGDNHDALASLWATLASVDYFGGLVLDEKTIFVGATADSTIVVPTTASEIEAMDYDDLLAAAAYRYDYCTAKYSLTNFAGRTLSVSFGSSSLLKSTINETSLTVIVIVVSLVSLTAGCFFLLRKKKHQ